MTATIKNECKCVWWDCTCSKSFSKPCTFNVIFSKAAGCSTSPEAINITASAETSDSYQVGQTSRYTTIGVFTSDSIYCTQSTDIVYSMAVTTSTPSVSTSFITFDEAARRVTWQTNDNT